MVEKKRKEKYILYLTKLEGEVVVMFFFFFFQRSCLLIILKPLCVSCALWNSESRLWLIKENICNRGLLVLYAANGRALALAHIRNKLESVLPYLKSQIYYEMVTSSFTGMER